MSSKSVLSCSSRCARTREICNFGCSRQLRLVIQKNGATGPLISTVGRVQTSDIKVPRRHYATQVLDVQRLRTDVDKRSRVGFYTLNKSLNVLHMDPHKADSIYADFVTQKNKLDHGANVQRLVQSAFVMYSSLNYAC